MIDVFGDNMCLLGPYKPRSAAIEFEELPHSGLHDALTSFNSKYGVAAHYGRWLIPGNPRVVLFDLSYPQRFQPFVDHARALLKVHYGIVTPVAPRPGVISDTFVFDALVFGVCVALFLAEYREHPHSPCLCHTVAHYHEWSSGIGLLLLRLMRLGAPFLNLEINGYGAPAPPAVIPDCAELFSQEHSPTRGIASVFTTHATSLGRHLSAGGVALYADNSKAMREFTGPSASYEEARRRGMEAEHATERACAHAADCFTTVSDITGLEAEHLLGKKPDVVTPNGLDLHTSQHQAYVRELQNQHVLARAKVFKFLRAHFWGQLDDIDESNTRVFFTAGRCEVANKGLDVTIEALARLNARMKAEGLKETVVFIIVMPAETTTELVSTLRGLSLQHEMEKTCSAIGDRLAARVLAAARKGDLVSPADLLARDDIVALKAHIQAQTRYDLPPVVTHNLVDPDHEILRLIRNAQLFNLPEDRVKIVYHPAFISPTSPLFDGASYDDFVHGCHLGIFPSLYEPFGYTPCECQAAGVPSITTNLAGFGREIEQHEQHRRDAARSHAHDCPYSPAAVGLSRRGPTDPADTNVWRRCLTGVYIVDRIFQSVDETITQLANACYDFVTCKHDDRVVLRARTAEAGLENDWARLVERYTYAHDAAMAKAGITFPRPGGQKFVQ
jgi:glycogen(starch) synthase